jgi:hypothetical protein
MRSDYVISRRNLSRFLFYKDFPRDQEMEIEVGFLKNIWE